ncbi:PH domain-containing protein [Aliiglaciecola sp. LCG003]|uniref:PH domain-containing protein n=1 Tax=Aliiglaciecola sp. LCG003 TaxID=3053655 RepID=UPI0025731EEC|nr:PH domain-containing protein [Aliiglaciecola sp. LCG003]WJG08030.1 PH domain-containing protein [Aliiglaciecola sp. LCG003]
MADQDAIISPNKDDWQRLSPIAILYFIASGIKLAAGNMIYIVPALAISYSTLQEKPHVWLPVVIAVIAFIVLSSVLQYVFYTFRLKGQTVEIRSGVLSKKNINLPFERIQNVTIEQPLYYRLNNHACLQLDTAGSAKQEAKIVALPMDYAKYLKSQILQQKSIQINEPSAEEKQPQSPTEQLINSRSIKDLILHGITNNRVWIILGVLAPVYDDIASYMVSWLDSIGIDYQSYFDIQTQSIWQVALTGLLLIIIVAGSLSLLSVLGSIVMFYQYTLHKTDDKYVRRSGLFTRQEVTMRLSRLQLLVFKQDWLDVLLGRINLEMKQNSSAGQHANQIQQNNKIIVPSVTHHQALAISEDALELNQLRNVEFNSISKRFIWRQIIYWLLPLNILASGFVLTHANPFGLVIVEIVTFVALVLIWCRWKRWGYAADPKYFYIRKGLFGVNHYCFANYKVQQSKFVQNPIMRRHNLANIVFILASGSLAIPFMPAKVAKDFLANTLQIVSQQKRSWM